MIAGKLVSEIWEGLIEEGKRQSLDSGWQGAQLPKLNEKTIIEHLIQKGLWPIWNAPWNKQPRNLRRNVFGLFEPLKQSDNGTFHSTFPGCDEETYRNRLRSFLSAVRGIKHEKLRILVTIILRYAPLGFWVAPASSTGKHHGGTENRQNGVGGLLIHCVEMAKMVKGFAQKETEHLNLNNKALFLVEQTAIGACLIHDVLKGYRQSEHGPYWQGYNTDHGLIGALLVETVAYDLGIGREMFPLPDGYGNELTLSQALALGVFGHSLVWERLIGEWLDGGWGYRFSLIEYIVHLADMTSTGKVAVSLDRANKEPEKVLAESMTEYKAGTD